ncbi:MAG: hypothetical protein HY898_32820 [Deltaproteobacteria bacterium]|nr:hypothetical protein [Deltaproteobacteria bacterium]
MKSSKRGGSRGSKHSPPSSIKPSAASTSDSTPSSGRAARLKAKAELRSVSSESSEHSDSDHEVQAAAAPKQKLSLLEQFNSLPSTTRYAVVGAIVAFLIGVAYFVSTATGAGSQPGARSAAPTGADLAPPVPVVVPPGIASALNVPASPLPSGLLIPGSSNAPPTSAAPGKPSDVAVPKAEPLKPEPPKSGPPKPEPPKAPQTTPEQPKPVPPPAKKAGGGDNPY